MLLSFEPSTEPRCRCNCRCSSDWQSSLLGEHWSIADVTLMTTTNNSLLDQLDPCRNHNYECCSLNYQLNPCSHSLVDMEGAFNNGQIDPALPNSRPNKGGRGSML